MARFIISTALALGVVAAPAEAATHHYRQSTQALSGKYEHLYFRVQHHYGHRTPGRDIVRFGVRTHHGQRVRDAHRWELRRSMRTFRRWLAPPPPPVVASDRAPVTARVAATPQLAGGRYAIPSSIVNCESHGNYGAVNPSSGARGAYQIMGGTHAALCADLGWSPPEQDACAARIWASQGRGAWSC